MSQHENPSALPSQPAANESAQAGYQPSQPGYQPSQPGYQPSQQAPAGYQPSQQPAPGGTPEPNPRQRNVIGLIALIVAVVGFIFACIPGALVVGWVLLPIAFILAIVSFFQRGKGKGVGIAALIVSVVGTIVGVIVFMAVIATSFEQAFDTGSTVVTPETSVEEQAEPDAAPSEEVEAASEPEDAAVGTRDNPVPIGSAISSDEWTVTIDAVNREGNQIVADANMFNEAAEAGFHYEIVTYTVTYTGEDSSMAAMVGVDLVTDSGNVINSYDSMAVLEDEMGLDELFNGASSSGSTAFLVPDGETTLVRVRPGMLADEIFVQP